MDQALKYKPDAPPHHPLDPLAVSLLCLSLPLRYPHVGEALSPRHH